LLTENIFQHYWYIYKSHENFSSVCISSFKGEGWITRALSSIPAELHLPVYNFCGPNTKLKERLVRGDKGINPLNEACLEHDKVYASTKDSQSINEANKVLARKAWQSKISYCKKR
jgi:hypothetical protein